MNVHAYIRTSTGRQELSPEAQEHAIRAWCQAHGHALASVHVDKLSGTTPIHKRPGLLAALDGVGRGEALVVLRRDRLARDTLIAAMVDKLAAGKRAAVLCVEGAGNGDGPDAELIRRILDAVSAYERAIIAMRTSAALQAKRRRSERMGGKVRLGERVAADGVHVEAHDAEAAAVATIASLRAEGRSVRAIADELNARGVSARGSRWHATTVARVLARAA